MDSEQKEQSDDKRDLLTVKREDFLNIYKEGEQTQTTEDAPDLSQGIKFKRDADKGFELKTSETSDKKPLIMELDTPALADESKALAQAEEIAAEAERAFNWETAERFELKGQFITQGDYVFLNMPLRGYDREQGVRYALSSDEILIEVREKNRVHRLCQCLTQQVDVSLSEIQLLVDFICVKLCKAESGSNWSALGYDIKEFTIPKKTQMKSNFLQKAAPLEEPDMPATPSTQASTPAPQVEEIPLTEEEIEKKRDAEIARAIERQASAMVTYLELHTESIYKIY